MDVVEEADKVKIVAVERMMRNAKFIGEYFTDIIGIFRLMRITLFVSYGKIPGWRTEFEPSTVTEPKEHSQIIHYVRPAAADRGQRLAEE